MNQNHCKFQIARSLIELVLFGVVVLATRSSLDSLSMSQLGYRGAEPPFSRMAVE